MKYRSIFALCAFAISLFVPTYAMAETRSFEDPMLGRYRLAYCRFQNADCGIMPALLYCQRMGYTMAQSYRGARDIEASTRIGDRDVCRGEACDGFAEIVCERPDRQVVEEPVEDVVPIEDDGTIPIPDFPSSVTEDTPQTEE